MAESVSTTVSESTPVLLGLAQHRAVGERCHAHIGAVAHWVLTHSVVTP